MEPKSLVAARQRLANAEANYLNDDGLADLQDGLALLDETVANDSSGYGDVARNLSSTYANKICAAIKRQVDANPGLPEPELKHLFNVLLAFDAIDTRLPDYARTLKIEIVKRLIDLTYEGYPAAEKQKMIEQLANLD